MDYTVSDRGLLVHARKDWPCALCRPDETSERRGFWLCVGCARSMIVAAEAGVAEARDLLDDVTDALVLLEGPQLEVRLALN